MYARTCAVYLVGGGLIEANIPVQNLRVKEGKGLIFRRINSMYTVEGLGESACLCLQLSTYMYLHWVGAFGGGGGPIIIVKWVLSIFSYRQY